MAKEPLSFKRALVATLIGLLGCLIVWVVVPYNNFLFKNSYISDSYLPEIVIGFLILLVILINPLLRLIGKSWMLTQRQVALICSLMLFAAVIPSNGLMRMFPHFVASSNQEMNTGARLPKAVAEIGFRQDLFPDPLPTLVTNVTPKAGDESGLVMVTNVTAKVSRTPVSDQFIDELEEGKSIPWKAWVKPMMSWGMLVMAVWIMMVGLAGIVFPQWRDKERLPFPLLHVYEGLTGDPDDKSGRTLPAIFYNKSFWAGCIVVFIIHAFRGLNEFTGAFPSFPLRWELRQYFTDSVLRYAPQAFNWQVIFFSVVGVAYFIPSRYAISIWGWVFFYSWYLTLGKAYIPSFQEGQVGGQAFGVLVAIAVWVLILGRSHWAQVGRAMLGKAGNSEEAKRNAVAGWIFAIGCAGIFLWLHWAGCPIWWSIVATVACAVIGLVMARVIAETGIPALWTTRISVASVTALFPAKWLSPQVFLFMHVFYAIVSRATAVSCAVMSTLALGADRRASPKHHSRLMIGGIGVLLIGFVVCGAVHLNMGYNNADVGTSPKMGAGRIMDFQRAQTQDYEFFTKERGHQITGFGVGTAMLWACSRFPAWPIHPLGILFCRISIGSLLWFSVFLGWLLKTFITRVFGGGAYRRARPLFLGLVLGELLAVIVWAIVPIVIVVTTGADPADVPRYVLMSYP